MITLDDSQSIQCNMLCPLHLKFDTNELQIKSKSDSDGPMVEFVSTESNVFFKKVAYKLVSMYIRKAIHKQEFEYECVFVHQNTALSSQMLYIFVPLSESTSVGLSYSFFNKFPTHNVANTVIISIDENLNPAHTYPTQKEFYWYHSDFDPITNTSVAGGEFIRIVFTHATNIHPDILEKRIHGGSGGGSGGGGGDVDITPHKLFKNNGSTVSYEGVTQQSIITKCYPTYQTDGVKLTKEDDDIDGGDGGDDGDGGDSDDDEEIGELEEDVGEEDDIGRRMLVFLVGFVGVFLILGFFKAGSIFNFERLHYIGKFIGLFIWLPYHINYIYFARFFISILLGICLGFASLINVFMENSYPEIFKGALKEGIYNRPEYPITAVLTILWAISSRTQMSFYELPSMRHIPKDSICRNNVRYIGGTQIDPCYRESDMRKYITNPNDRKKFIDEFKQARKKGKNAENSMKIAVASLDNDFIDIHKNYTKPHMMNGVEIGKWEYLFCDLWNNMFSKKNNRKNCTSFTKTRQSTSDTESSDTCDMNPRSPGSTETSTITINGGGTNFEWNGYDCIKFSDDINNPNSLSILIENIPHKNNIVNVLDEDVVSLKLYLQIFNEIEGILFIDGDVNNKKLVFCPLLKTHKFTDLNEDFILTINPELKYTFKLGSESEYNDSLPLFAGRQTLEGDYSNVAGTWNLPDSYGRQYINVLNGDPILPYDVLLYKRDHPVVTFSVKGFEQSLAGYIFKEDNHIHFLFNEDSKCLLNASRNKELRIIGIETFHKDQVYSGIPFFSGNFNRVLKLESPARDYGFTQEIKAFKSENTFEEYLSDFSSSNALQNRLNDYYNKSMVNDIPTFESIFDGPVVRFISLKKKRGIKCLLFKEDSSIYAALGDQGRVIKKRNKKKKKTKKKVRFYEDRRFDIGEGLVIKVLHYSPNDFKYNSSNKTISALIFDDSIGGESITEDGVSYSELSGRKEYTEFTGDWLKPNHNAGNIYLKLLKRANKLDPTLSVTLCDREGNEYLGYIKDNDGIVIFESTSGTDLNSGVYRIKMFESTGWDDVDQFRRRVYMTMINLLEI